MCACRAPFIATGCAALLAALYGLLRLPETRAWKECEQRLESRQPDAHSQGHQAVHSAPAAATGAAAAGVQQAAAAAPAQPERWAIPCAKNSDRGRSAGRAAGGDIGACAARNVGHPCKSMVLYNIKF